jgi:integrase
MRGQVIEKSKGVWLVRIESKKNGKRKSVSKQIRGTKKDAEKFRTKWLREIDTGVFVEPSVLTVNSYLDQWLTAAVRPRVSERTADGYAGLLKRYIREPLGEKKLENLQPLDIQKVYAEMQSRGLSARIVRHTHAALHNALKQAVKWNLLQRNPAEIVELPKVPHKERRVLTDKEAVTFLHTTNEMPHGLIFEFALLSGMRPEEYLALQWADLNFDKGTAQVKRALVRHGGKWSFQETKTARSRRIVSLPQPLFTKLKAHKRRQSEQRLKAGLFWQNFDLVFSSENGTPHSVPNLTYRYFRPILEKAGLPQIRLYDLRHSHATLLLLADENPKIVAERLGHSTVVLTLDTYSHILPSMQQQTTAKLTKMLYDDTDIKTNQKTA